MPLYFEEDVIGESVRSVPTMINVDFLIFAIFDFFPLEAVMLDITSSLKIKDRKNDHQ